MPFPNVNINNVSMEYFLRGVEAARPQGPRQPQVPGQQAPEVQPPQQHPAGKLVTQLDVLLLAAAREIDSRNAEALRDRMLQDPGITLGEDGTLSVDASKVADKAILGVLVDLTGEQCVALPDTIDRETYDAFMALKSGPRRQAYLDSIRPRLSEASYNAAVRRLDDTIALAERLKNEGRLVEEKDGSRGWLDETEVPRQTGKIAVRKLDGREKRLGGEFAKNLNRRTCPSYFARDGFEKLFA